MAPLNAPPVDWPTVPLGDVCDLKYGKALAASQRSGSGFPVFGSNGEVGRHKQSLTGGPTIIVGRKGSFGEVTYSAEACWPIDTTYYIDETATRADLRWLFHRLKGLPLKQLNRAAAIPGLNREDAYAQLLMLPPIEEQRKIAAALDLVDELRSKRSEALLLVDTFIESAYQEIFADSRSQANKVSIGALAAPVPRAIRTGPFGSDLLHSEFVGSGVAVLGIDNAVQDRFAWGQRRFITQQKYEKLRQFTVFPGDVIISIMGTCGRVAVVPDDIPLAINTKHLCCITLNQEVCLPWFLWAAFRFDIDLRRQLGAAAKGAVMPGLNKTLIESAMIRVPPVTLQREFVERISRADTVGSKVVLSSRVLDELQVSLCQRAFRGGL